MLSWSMILVSLMMKSWQLQGSLQIFFFVWWQYMTPTCSEPKIISKERRISMKTAFQMLAFLAWCFSQNSLFIPSKTNNVRPKALSNDLQQYQDSKTSRDSKSIDRNGCYALKPIQLNLKIGFFILMQINQDITLVMEYQFLQHRAHNLCLERRYVLMVSYIMKKQCVMSRWHNIANYDICWEKNLIFILEFRWWTNEHTENTKI